MELKRLNAQVDQRINLGAGASVASSFAKLANQIHDLALKAANLEEQRKRIDFANISVTERVNLETALAQCQNNLRLLEAALS